MNQSPLDSSSRNPLAIAERLAKAFATTAADRDKHGGTPKLERDGLRESGLLTATIPADLGGWGVSWPDLFRVVRCFGRADPAIAHVFGFHHLMLATIRLFGTPEQSNRYFAETVRRGWFWGNALNPLDARTSVVPHAGGRVLRGAKSFCSGAKDSDMLIVSAIQEGASRLTIAALPSDRAGIRIHDDWDCFGQRQTDSGSVNFDDVEVHEDEILSTPGPLGSIFASLRPCFAQLIFSNVLLGIAEGALQEARTYTTSQTRAWFLSGVSKPSQDPYVLRHYGELWVELEAARLLTEKAGDELADAWAKGDRLTAEERGRCAIAIAAAKVKTTRSGLDIASRMFEVMGARATAGHAGLDRYWRNIRTLTLHDPVDYKLRDLGRWALEGELPQPSFYS